MQGLVVKNNGNIYLVKLLTGEYIECRIKGNFRLKGIRSTNPLAIGDNVLVDVQPNGDSMIFDICDRKNYIVRKSSNLSKHSHIIAANLDQAILVVTVNYPVTATGFIDRFIVSAEAYHVPVILVFNKIDLYSDSDIEYLHALKNLYQHIGYRCIETSVITNEGIEELSSCLSSNISLFSGNSGVGKSSLIRVIDPSFDVKVGIISDSHNKGMHTTTNSQMYEVSGGFIIDTPGIKGFGIIDIAKQEAAHYFKDIFQFSHQCKYNNCTHQQEPGCAVIKAVEDYKISLSRYQSYLSIIQDIEEDAKYRH